MSNKIKSSLFVFAIVSCVSFPIFAEAESEGRSEATGDMQEYRSPTRFVRRVIVHGARTGTAYQGDNASQYTNPLGYMVGLGADFGGQGNFVVELGGYYRQENTTVNNGFINDRFRAEYVSIPLNAKYYFIDQESSSPYLKAGAMGSFLVSDNTVPSGGGIQIGAQDWESALMGGVGYKFYASNLLDVIVEADYVRGLDSLFADTSAYRSDINLGLGLAFNF